MSIANGLSHKIWQEIKFWFFASVLWLVISILALILNRSYDFLNALIWSLGGGVLVNFWFIALFSIFYLVTDFIESKITRILVFTLVIAWLLIFVIQLFPRLAIAMIQFNYGILIETSMLIVSMLYCLRRAAN